MDIIKQLLRNSKSEHWVDANRWIAWSLLGFLPVLGTIILLLVYQQEVLLSVFTDNGEFAIYSATYLGAAFYIVMKDYKSKSFPSRSAVAFVLVLLLLFAAFLYSHVAVHNFLAEKGQAIGPPHFDKEVVRGFSRWLLPMVFVLTYFIVVAENIRTEPDPVRIAEGQFNTFRDEFDHLGDDEI